MNIHDATEIAYKNGYQQAVKDILEELRKAGIDEWRYPVIGDLKKEYLELDRTETLLPYLIRRKGNETR